jgi:hypothetical protein
VPDDLHSSGGCLSLTMGNSVFGGFKAYFYRFEAVENNL